MMHEYVDFEEVVTGKTESLEEMSLADIVFPEELNKVLRDRIRDLTAENGSLRRALKYTEEKLERAENNNISTTHVPGIAGKSNEIATVKIIELSRKCRDRTAEIEVLKTKCKNLESSLAAATTELQKKTFQGEYSKSSRTLVNADGTDGSQSSIKDEEEKVKTLTEKLQQAEAKYHESKNTCTALKQELHKAQKLLCREVGENVTIAGLLNQPCGWRGRAEQMQMLQQKIRDLQHKLSEYEGKGSFDSLSRKSHFDLLRINAKERRQQAENSAKEIRQTEVALEASRRKLDAARARIKVLESEVNVMRSSVAILNEKKSHDDQLIETLTSHLKSAEMKNQEHELNSKYREEKLERDCMVLQNNAQAAQLQIVQLRKNLEEREKELDKLKKRASTDELIRPQIVSSENTTINYHRTNSSDDLMSTIQSNDYATLVLAAESEKEKLLELVTELNKRLNNERHEVDALTVSLRDERYKCAKLKSKVRKLEMERIGLFKIENGYRSKISVKSLKLEEDFWTDEKLRLRVQLLEEECLVYKSRLDTIQQEKDADVALYKEMLQQTRKIFYEARSNELPAATKIHSTITI